jgi:hypothetical protein
VAATPLISSHAVFVRLARNIEQDRIAERPEAVRRLR